MFAKKIYVAAPWPLFTKQSRLKSTPAKEYGKDEQRTWKGKPLYRVEGLDVLTENKELVDAKVFVSEPIDMEVGFGKLVPASGTILVRPMFGGQYGLTLDYFVEAVNFGEAA